MTSSNLSKIKPKLRTEGRVSGNFGRNKERVGSPLKDIGMTNVKVVRITNPDIYLKRLYDAYEMTTDPKIKNFCYEQIRKILIQRNLWK